MINNKAIPNITCGNIIKGTIKIVPNVIRIFIFSIIYNLMISNLNFSVNG